jgi:hypothetical protein
LASFVAVSIVNGMPVFRLNCVQKDVSMGCLSLSEMVVEDGPDDRRQHRRSGQ